jgi:hypothetical protein
MEWRPISEAPPEHDDILLWTRDGACVGYRAFTDTELWCMDAGMFVEYVQPTHWMPLPSPPEVGDGS